MTENTGLYLGVNFLITPKVEQHCINDDSYNTRDLLVTQMRVLLDNSPGIVNEWFNDLESKLNEAVNSDPGERITKLMDILSFEVIETYEAKTPEVDDNKGSDFE